MLTGISGSKQVLSCSQASCSTDRPARSAAGPGGVARHQAVEALEEGLRFLAGLAPEGLGHHGGGGGGDRAARALEAHVPDHLAFELDEDGGLVAAEWVEAVRPGGGRRDLS